MAGYLAMRIIDRALNYTTVITRYPTYQADIDKILTNEGYAIDESGWAYKVNP